MKIEKRLKQEADYTNRQILEDGQDVRESLIRDFCKPASEITATKQKNIKKPLWITVSCLIVCSLIIGICCLTLLPDKDIVYLKENEIASEITFEELTDNVNIELNRSNFTITSPQKTMDSISQDILFYSLQFESRDIFPYGQISFSKNKNYKFQDKYTVTNSCEWNNCEVKYSVIQANVEELPVLIISGQLNYNDIRIFFEYNDIDLGEQVTPTDFLNSLLTL